MLLQKFLASRLQLLGQLIDYSTKCADVDAMKLPINPDPETVWGAANHMWQTLFRLTLQLMFQAPALCCHRDPFFLSSRANKEQDGCQWRPVALHVRAVMHIKLFVKEMGVNFPGSGELVQVTIFEKGYPFGWRSGCCVVPQGSKDLFGNGLVD